MKQIIVIALAVLLLGGAAIYFLTSNSSYKAPLEEPERPSPVTTTDTAENEDAEESDEAEDDDEETERPSQEDIGTSVDGTDITAHHYGDGETEILFIGGIHGGYSYNTSLVAYELMDYLEENENDLPEDITVTVIPVMNPDGLREVTGVAGRFDGSSVSATESARIAARFNSNEVDLNRNFNCDWSEESAWRNQTVSGGDAAFSEPESAAVRDYIDANDIAAAVVWFSAEGAVYPSTCGGSPSTESVELAATFGAAAGYSVEAEFDAYTINGDMVNWLAREDVPAISVLLSNHTDPEWSQNRRGVDAIIESLTDVAEE